MLGRDNKSCSICGQNKPSKYFSLLGNICIVCQKIMQRDASSDGDEGGGGGKQLQHNRGAQNLHNAMELDIVSEKNRNETYAKTLDKALFQLAEHAKNEQTTQQLQRELSDEKEQEKNKNNDGSNDPNYTEDTKVKRSRNTHLFSVTRNAALNLRAQNMARENNTPKTNKNNSSFYQQHFVNGESLKQDAEKLVNALREVQSIFKR